MTQTLEKTLKELSQIIGEEEAQQIYTEFTKTYEEKHKQPKKDFITYITKKEKAFQIYTTIIKKEYEEKK